MATRLTLTTNTSLGTLLAMFQSINTQMIAPHILMIRKLPSATKAFRNGFPSWPIPLFIRNWLMIPSATTSDNNVPRRYSMLRSLRESFTVNSPLVIIALKARAVYQRITRHSAYASTSFWPAAKACLRAVGCFLMAPFSSMPRKNRSPAYSTSMTLKNALTVASEGSKR